MNEARLLAAGLPAPAQPGLRAGGVFAGYTLIAEVGRGAMGVVFTAQQRGSQRIVAIKFAHGSLAGSAEAMRRFRTEAEAVAALEHPGILPIYEVGEHDGMAYHTMRFAEAGSLAERLEDFRDTREAAVLLAKIAEAVQHAHTRGILHRDLKPGNVLLADGAPLVTDFGLARWVQRASDVTASMSVLGTPDYLAPEMLRSAREGSTTAADLFSLGAILYHLLAGRAPFAAESVAQVLRNVEECAPPALHGIPCDLAAICMKCLEREPTLRYASAAALAADLRAWLGGHPVAARPVGVAGQFARWVRRKPVLAGLTVALSVSLVALGVNIVVSRQRTLASEQRRADIAERFAREQRRTALIAQAQLGLQSHRAARRTESLALLREAWQLAPSPDIRTAAISALALPQMRESVAPAGVTFVEPEPLPDLEITRPARIVARAFHAATQRLAAASEDKFIYLLNAESRTVIRRLRAPAGVCRAISFSPDGHWLATASDDQTLRLWEVRSGRELLRLERRSLAPAPLRWSSDGQWLAVTPQRCLRIEAAAVARFFLPEAEDGRTEELNTIDLSADGRWLVTVTESGTRLWETATRRDVAQFPKVEAEWSAARFSPDSRQLWIGGWNSNLRVVDLSRGGEPAFVAPVFFNHLAGALYEQSPDGQWLVAVSNARGGFQFVAAQKDRGNRWLKHPHPLALAMSPDGRRAATSSFDSAGVRVWDLASAKLLRELPAEPPAQLAFAADGGTLATMSDQTVTFWNTESGTRTEALRIATQGHSLAFSADGHLLAIETRSGLMLHRAAPPFEELARLTTAPDRGTASFRFSPDGRHLVVQTATGGAILWSLDALERELSALGMAW